MTKEEILSKKPQYSRLSFGLAGGDENEYTTIRGAQEAMDEYAKPYKEIADLISRIFYYGNFKAETTNERILEQRLRQVGLWPTSEHMILQRPEIKFIEQQNKP